MPLTKGTIILPRASREICGQRYTIFPSYNSIKPCSARARLIAGCSMKPILFAERAAALGVSIVSGKRSEMRCRLVRKIKHYLIDVTPTPALRRIIGFDDWMAGCAEMLGRVSIGRFIAAANMPASPADA
jgi:hypothetical protein